MDDSTPQTKKTSPSSARIGLLIALAGLAQVILSTLFSLFMLFFGPLIMCGVGLTSVPFSLGAIIMGWRGRKESPREAWIALLIGLLLVPLSLGIAVYLGGLVGGATR